VLDQRGQLLRAALGFAGLSRPSYDRSLWALNWLDSWTGIGHVVVGMARQGFDGSERLRSGRAPIVANDPASYFN
jgi:hypothetical protein